MELGVPRSGSWRPGKSERPDGGGHQPPPPVVHEGDDADAAVAESQRKTTSRRDLSRNPRFEQISPEVGELDEAAVEEGLVEDPDETMALLADLAGATDVHLRELARRLAGRLFLDVASRGPIARPRGVGKIRELSYAPDRGDIDLDASFDAIAEANGMAIDPERLRVRGWVRPDTAWCLVVDRSGSMGGKPLATAALAAAAVASRSPNDYSVLAFGKDVVVTKSQDVAKGADRVVNDMLSLRGHGTTDLAGALRAAAEQLGRSRAGRKIAVVLSDCRATVDGDAVGAAGLLDEVVVIAPESDAEEASAFASAVGASFTTVSGPSTIATAINAVLSS